MPTPISAKQAQIYGGFDNNLTPLPTTGDLSVLSTVQSVKTAIENLVLLGTYERPYSPNIGGNVDESLFEIPSVFTAEAIKTKIETVIKNGEPRADLLEVYVSVNPDQNSYTATIVFGIQNLTTPVTLTLPIFRRVR